MKTLTKILLLLEIAIYLKQIRIIIIIGIV